MHSGVPAVGTTASTAPGRPAPSTDFAALLAAQQRDPEHLDTVTLGELLGTRAPTGLSAVPTTVGAIGPPATDPAGGATAMRWPVHGRTTSEFGPRVHPVTGARRDHDGLDIAAATGTAIGAAAPGRVTFAGVRGGYGNVVIIDHGDGTESLYAHQDSIAVSVGQHVHGGQRIGSVGSTGMSTGPHLHFEVRRDGAAVDPRALLGR